jgi:hypothetical protein
MEPRLEGKANQARPDQASRAEEQQYGQEHRDVQPGDGLRERTQISEQVELAHEEGRDRSHPERDLRPAKDAAGARAACGGHQREREELPGKA